MRYLFIIPLFFSIKAYTQIADTATSLYVQVPQSFIAKYNAGKLKVGVSQFNAVQANDGKWYTSANSIRDFEVQLTEAGITKANIISRIVRLKASDFPITIAIFIGQGTTTKTIQ